MRGPCVTYDAVKRQLELLGHNVPDEAIRAYLSDLQKGSSNGEPPKPSSEEPAAEHFKPREPVRKPVKGIYMLIGARYFPTAVSLSPAVQRLPSCLQCAARAVPGSREGDQGLDELCDNFESTRSQGGAAASVSASAYRRGHDMYSSCPPRSNPRAADPLVSEEVMTRAQSILNEHHTGHTDSESRRCEAPASERLRSQRPLHISGTLQPRASTTHPDFDEPPANIAPDGFTSRCAPHVTDCSAPSVPALLSCLGVTILSCTMSKYLYIGHVYRGGRHCSSTLRCSVIDSLHRLSFLSIP